MHFIPISYSPNHHHPDINTELVLRLLSTTQSTLQTLLSRLYYQDLSSTHISFLSSTLVASRVMLFLSLMLLLSLFTQMQWINMRQNILSHSFGAFAHFSPVLSNNPLLSSRFFLQTVVQQPWNSSLSQCVCVAVNEKPQDMRETETHTKKRSIVQRAASYWRREPTSRA